MSLIGITAKAIKNLYEPNSSVLATDFEVYGVYTYGEPQRITDFAFSPTTITGQGIINITIGYGGFTKVVKVESAYKNDRVYGYNKKTLAKYLIGEIQNDFNMSFVIDGTKDSCQIVILNRTMSEYKPNTIVYLESTQTWWIIKSDTSKRYNDESASGLWEHTIQLIDPMCILNVRDMVNCGFNANKYTYNTFFTRLAKMFNFELPITWNFNNVVNGNTRITYLKSFENYTPFSAIREMADGMNAVAKLSFSEVSTGSNTFLSSANIKFISKSGDTSIAELDGNTYFTNSEQTISSDSSSYGSCVVSNVQNCVSPSEIRYPAVGGVKLTGLDKQIRFQRGSTDPNAFTNNAVVRLPSNVYKMNKMVIYREYQITNGSTTYNFYNYNNSVKVLVDMIKLFDPNFDEEEFEQDLEYFLDYSTIEIKNGGYWENDGNGGDLWFGDIIEIGSEKYMLNDKKHYETSKSLHRTIYWEQGSNLVQNFDFCNLRDTTSIYDFQYSYTREGQEYTLILSIPLGATSPLIGLRYRYAFYYVPMSDLKVKTENSLNEKDTNLYNQNGKLVDGSSVSKLMNAHSIEISGNNVMLSKNYYNFNDIPKVGQRVNDGLNTYVINNISLDFYPNDNYGYLIYAQFNMSKDTSCKSIMISANTNIRDYDCPQQNNINRIQTYRDIFFLTPNILTQSETPYLALDEIFNFGSSNAGLYKNYTTFIRVQDTEFISANNIGGYYYYVLGTTKYDLNKQTIIQCNFNDNNIIGYESGNSYKLITPQNLFTMKSSSINTPISYVNSIGHLNKISLYYSNEDSLLNIYEDDNIGSLGASVSIPSEIYTRATNYSSIQIDESTYDKDGLEVPIFQYSAQVINYGVVVIGNKFISSFKDKKDGTDFAYIYAFKSSYISEDNFRPPFDNYGNCNITKQGRNLNVELVGNTLPINNSNIAIFIYYRNTDNTYVYEMLFALNNYTQASLTSIDLKINNYKLK